MRKHWKNPPEGGILQNNWAVLFKIANVMKYNKRLQDKEINSD